MGSQSQTPNVSTLFQNAHDDGVLSGKSLQALTVVDIGAQIQAGLGAPVDDIKASEVVLVTQMPDDSSSIACIRENARSRSSQIVGPELIRQGHNLILDDVLANSKQKDGVLAHTRYLNGFVLFPYCTLDQAVRMDPGNYDPKMGTPLYDQSVVLLGTVMAKTQEFADNGVPVRTITLIISDGADLHSRRQTPKTVAAIVEDMLRAENHIIAAMGIDDGSTDFRRVFGEMGVSDQWILTPGNSPTEIRAAFKLVSQSAVRASQNAASFSQTAQTGLGGFGSP